MANTSSLVLCLSGIIKDVALVILSTILFQKNLTQAEVVGYAIALWGLYKYKRRKRADHGASTVQQESLLSMLHVRSLVQQILPSKLLGISEGSHSKIGGWIPKETDAPAGFRKGSKDLETGVAEGS